MNGLPVKASQLFAQDAKLLIGTGPERVRLEARFWSKVRRGNDNECWEWTGTLTKKGYGQFHLGDKENGSNFTTRAHRVAYWLFKGPISDGLEIDHLCRNRLCVNPKHMELVTPYVNTMRGNSPIARQVLQTHCIHGHPFDLFNTYYTKRGRRDCRQCQRDSQKRRRAPA